MKKYEFINYSFSQKMKHLKTVKQLFVITFVQKLTMQEKQMIKVSVQIRQLYLSYLVISETAMVKSKVTQIVQG